MWSRIDGRFLALFHGLIIAIISNLDFLLFKRNWNPALVFISLKNELAIKWGNADITNMICKSWWTSVILFVYSGKLISLNFLKFRYPKHTEWSTYYIMEGNVNSNSLMFLSPAFTWPLYSVSLRMIFTWHNMNVFDHLHLAQSYHRYKTNSLTVKSILFMRASLFFRLTWTSKFSIQKSFLVPAFGKQTISHDEFPQKKSQWSIALCASTIHTLCGLQYDWKCFLLRGIGEWHNLISNNCNCVIVNISYLLIFTRVYRPLEIIVATGNRPFQISKPSEESARYKNSMT